MFRGFVASVTQSKKEKESKDDALVYFMNQGRIDPKMFLLVNFPNADASNRMEANCWRCLHPFVMATMSF